MHPIAALFALLAQSPEPAADRAPTDSDKLIELQGRLTALEEQYAETKTDVLNLKNFKMSGYIQPRYTWSETSKTGIDAKGAPRVTDGFNVRRGRLKATYTGAWSQFLLQLDAVPKEVFVKTIEAHLIEPWTGKKFELIMGQTDWPFGFEIPYSSGDMEFPERSRVSRAFGPGEVDRGAKIVGRVGPLRLMGGAFEGNGRENKQFVAVDNDRFKDAIGRVGVDFDWIAGGVSGWYGRDRRPADAAATPPLKSKVFLRKRVGADLQVYLDLLPFGATALKAEGIMGETYTRSNAEQYGNKGLGYYALLVQNIGTDFAIAARYDWFDGDTDEDAAADSKDATKPATNNAIGTAGVSLIHYWDDVLKITVCYEMPVTETVSGSKDPKDNLVTLQMQAKF